jgi:hypothetical protein
MSILRYGKKILAQGGVLMGGGKGGGGGGGQTQQSSQYTNLTPWAQPYVSSILGAGQQQVFDVSKDESGNQTINGIRPYNAYGSFNDQGGQYGINPSAQAAANAAVAGFQPLQNQAYQGLQQQEAQDYARRYQDFMQEEKAKYADELRQFETKTQLQAAINANKQATMGDISNLGFQAANLAGMGAFGENYMFGGYKNAGGLTGGNLGLYGSSLYGKNRGITTNKDLEDLAKLQYLVNPFNP